LLGEERRRWKKPLALAVGVKNYQKVIVSLNANGIIRRLLSGVIFYTETMEDDQDAGNLNLVGGRAGRLL